MEKSNKYIIIMVFLLVTGCSDFLDEKPTLNLLIPETISDLEELLDGTTWGINNTPAILEISTDNLYTTDAGFLGFNVLERNAFTWQEVIYEVNGPDWDRPYAQIFYANVVLDKANSVEVTSDSEQIHLDEVKGRAYFIRAQAYFQLLSTFAASYEPGGNNDSPGVPIRLSPNVLEPVQRNSVQEGYSQIISDLENAEQLLPDIAQVRSRASKNSVYALLSRLYLIMGDFERSETYGKKALEINSALINFNNLNLELARPFTAFNEEVIQHYEMLGYPHISSALIFIDSSLVGQFEENDLRKEAFFTETPFGMNFDGNYTGTIRRFSGFATNEVYLNVAECAARRGDTQTALNYLNTLLVTRWKEGTFEPFAISDSEEVLDLILLERRKELIFRGIRWTDLRRLNREERFKKTLTRSIVGESFVLEPNSLRYVLPIPPEEIDISGIPQNPR
jgi:tetratricopeptide (TPR) repeat protein